MTRKDVISWLEYLSDDARSKADGLVPTNIEIACGMAIDALKAQEPMKPIRYQEGRWFKTWRCGACGSTLVFRNGEDKPNYCTDCGRPVKWE